MKYLDQLIGNCVSTAEYVKSLLLMASGYKNYNESPIATIQRTSSDTGKNWGSTSGTLPAQTGIACDGTLFNIVLKNTNLSLSDYNVPFWSSDNGGSWNRGTYDFRNEVKAGSYFDPDQLLTYCSIAANKSNKHWIHGASYPVSTSEGMKFALFYSSDGKNWIRSTHDDNETTSEGQSLKGYPFIWNTNHATCDVILDDGKCASVGSCPYMWLSDDYGVKFRSINTTYSHRKVIALDSGFLALGGSIVSQSGSNMATYVPFGATSNTQVVNNTIKTTSGYSASIVGGCYIQSQNRVVAYDMRSVVYYAKASSLKGKLASENIWTQVNTPFQTTDNDTNVVDIQYIDDVLLIIVKVSGKLCVYQSSSYGEGWSLINSEMRADTSWYPSAFTYK